VTGMVTKLNLQEGMHVNQGDLLARLEAVEYDSDFRKAQGTADGAWQRWLELATGNRPEEIEQVKHDLQESKALKDMYAKDKERYKDLIKVKGVSDKDLDQAI